ncbi:hypothetical protein LZ012_15955 [Dechloromonas sp. XY25]|uniref:Uncharacterized protein n=1 Tax=Dechloromonas hankyongensis TaxID=2908002 RepID=A0ABS9K5P7_9RHOO|nr:hypothetical protein [Dechloromonas hankyongensis]MCG2578490.1 hypothetical protein [Dechloromonas hankyongensis]
MTRPSLPRLTARIAAYALADIFGLFCVVTGASWFAAGKGAVVANFPNSLAEAVACTAGGAAVMVWAVARIRREIARQAPRLTARGDADNAARHPDKLGRPDEDGK